MYIDSTNIKENLGFDEVVVFCDGVEIDCCVGFDVKQGFALFNVVNEVTAYTRVSTASGNEYVVTFAVTGDITYKELID